MNEARKGFVGIPIYEAANINGDIFCLWDGYVMFLGDKVYATDCKILVRASVLEVCNFELEELKLLDGMAISAKMMKTLSMKNITKVSVEEVKLKREDASFNDAVETDILVARLALRATEVIINPVTYTGGKQVFSAEEIATGCRCFFDTEETFTAAVLHWTESNGVECKYTLRPIASMGKLPNFDAIFCEEREATDEIAFKPELIDRLGRAMGSPDRGLVFMLNGKSKCAIVKRNDMRGSKIDITGTIMPIMKNE